MQASTNYKKTWCLYNNGSEFIPKGSKLIMVEGDLNVDITPLNKDIPVDEFFYVYIKFWTPA